MSDLFSFVEKDQCYLAFHDKEWGVPVHDDKYVIFATLFKRSAMNPRN